MSDGKEREFGFEGLQALARSKCTLCLADLNLGGCFRVSSLTLKSISTMKMLCRLILNGCTNITLEGMTHVAANCSQIETISLNHCGLCVTDKMVELVASGMKKLQNVMLSGSPCIGSRSLVAISKCRFLRRLDLTNCILIDDTSLMALSEGDFIFGLHSLYLVGCKLVSNTGLTWITDGKSNLHGLSSIKMLSLKSTRYVVEILSTCLDDTNHIFQFLLHEKCHENWVDSGARTIQIFYCQSKSFFFWLLATCTRI